MSNGSSNKLGRVMRRTAMSHPKSLNVLFAVIAAIGLMSRVPLASAATLILSNVPLAAATSVVPKKKNKHNNTKTKNKKIMTPGYWTWRAYNPDEALIGLSFTSSNGGLYNEDGLWDSNYSTTSSGG